ncbi:MAPEG family protein [Porticoccaceae bacterium LTM1]|nr:MAPEG family protein [Porticoccaceae bacterium LTM1]
MNLTEIYTPALWGLLIILLTWIVQWFVASGPKARLPGAIPGKIDESLSHSSFVFRAHRTFMNSLENAPAILGTILLAFLVGAEPFWTALFIWVFAISRILHMVLYFAIATEKNPSPRTLFFMLGLLANIGLLGLCGYTLL